MTSLRDDVRAAVGVLEAAGVPSAGADAVLLAAHVLGVPAGEVRRLMALGGPPLVAPRFADLVAERARRVPLQHLTGSAPFRDLELEVGPGVFIPRPETELTAQLAIDAATEPAREADRGVGREVDRSVGRDAGRGLGRGPVVVDLCCGSGAIALSVKHEVPSAEVHGVELSDLALAWAVRNRDRLALDVELRLGDGATAFEDLAGAVDVVVSNPPYIPVGSVPNDPEVRDHDPEVALYGGSADGLAIPLAMVRRAAVLLRAGGTLVLEHADVQGQALARALAASGEWHDIQDHRDLAGRPRSMTARRR